MVEVLAALDANRGLRRPLYSQKASACPPETRRQFSAVAGPFGEDFVTSTGHCWISPLLPGTLCCFLFLVCSLQTKPSFFLLFSTQSLCELLQVHSIPHLIFIEKCLISSITCYFAWGCSAAGLFYFSLPSSLCHTIHGQASKHLLMLFPLPESPPQFLLSGYKGS